MMQLNLFPASHKWLQDSFRGEFNSLTKVTEGLVLWASSVISFIVEANHRIDQ